MTEVAMKLYYSPGACSLASHIALMETGAPFEIERADVRAKTTASGRSLTDISPRGAVPVLVADGGEVLTEGVAIMQYVTDALTPGALPAPGTLERARVQEALNFVATEVHKSYAPLFAPGLSDEFKAKQLAHVDSRLKLVEDRLSDGREWLTGATYCPADGYLFTITNWAAMMQHDLSKFPNLLAFRARVAARPAVQAAMKAEGLI
ncbi:MAG: glutathione transferase GstA [Gemmobacter sp.]